MMAKTVCFSLLAASLLAAAKPAFAGPLDEFRKDFAKGDGVWGAETNIYEAGRSQDIEGDYEAEISAEILSWPDMISN